VLLGTKAPAAPAASEVLSQPHLVALCIAWVLFYYPGHPHVNAKYLILLVCYWYNDRQAYLPDTTRELVGAQPGQGVF
jgi:hypothetical protein